jgi:hypothetical protein
MSAFMIMMFCFISQTTVIYADSILQSNNYQLSETTMGAGGLDQSSSTNYKINSDTSDLAVGEASSGNYQIAAGSTTTNDPTLSFVVSNPDANFSIFSPTQPSVATATFSVLNYTSWGYAAQIFGSPPTNGSHTIAAMSSQDISRPGTEQFGINLVANSSPSFGANPDNGQFGFGSIDLDYNQGDHFQYISPDIIASAPKSSGKTIYTISYLVNVSSVTPGGQYTSDQTIVITGTY